MLSFSVRQTKLCVTQRALLVNVLLVCLLLLSQSGISAELPEEIAERPILRLSLHHVAGKETEHSVSKQPEIQKRKQQAVKKHPQNGKHQRRPDTNVVDGVGSVASHQEPRQTLTEGRSVSKHMQKTPLLGEQTIIQNDFCSVVSILHNSQKCKEAGAFLVEVLNFQQKYNRRRSFLRRSLCIITNYFFTKIFSSHRTNHPVGPPNGVG